MPSCVVPTCRNAVGLRKKQDGITFHVFPAHEKRKSEWTKIIQKARLDELWKPSKRSVVCSIHFEEQYFYDTSGGLRRLSKGALPNKHLAFTSDNSESRMETTDYLEIVMETAGPSTPENVTLPHSAARSKSEIGDVNISDLDSVFNSPRRINLMSQLRRKQYFLERHVRRIKTLQQKNKLLAKKNESLKNILKNLKNNRYVNDDVYDLLSTNIVAVDVFNDVYKRSILKKKKITYTAQVRKFCLTLNFLSPTGYRYIRATFDTCLPHPKTLSKWYSNVSGEPGFSDESFSALKRKAASSERKIICSLIADEMPLRQQSLWDGKKNHGYVDMGTGTSEDCKTLASEAYVFLLNSINVNFKLPLGYFLVHGLNAEQKVNLINLCLIKCHESGVKVVSVTFDGHLTNLTAMKLLGCKLGNKDELKTTFEHPVDKSDVAVFLDPVLMFKLIRNSWESKKKILLTNGEEIDWNLLSKLNKLQENEELDIANKLTRRYIMFRNSIMKLKLGSQVLSKSVAKALKFCREDAKLLAFKNSEATESFVRNMNDLFDIFNSHNMIQFDYNQPLNSRNKEMIYTFLDKMKTYIGSLKIKNATKRKFNQDGKKVQLIMKNYKPILECACKTGFLGILIDIESLKSLYASLVENNKMLLFIPMYKCSQDHLELVFGIIRMHGGHNDNANAKQFKGIYQKVLCDLEIKGSNSGNCMPLENKVILNCSSSIKAINFSAHLQRFEDNDKLFSNVLSLPISENGGSIAKLLSSELPQLHDLSKYIIGYISGCVVLYLSKSIKCQFCIEEMLASDVLWFHKLIGLKNRGGLCFPSQSIYDICCICEAHVRRISNEDLIITSNIERLAVVVTILKQFIGKNNVFLFGDSHVNGHSHRSSLIRAIIERYLDIRLHYLSKCKTKQICPSSNYANYC